MIKKTGAIIIEGHVQGLANCRALGRKGIPVFVIDMNNCIARYSKFCSKFFKCPDFKNESFISFLIELAEKYSLRGWSLFPSNDHILLNLSRNREKLSVYYKIITPNYSIVKTIVNKQNLLNIAMSIGIDIPKTFYPEDLDLIDFHLDFPVLIKGKIGLTFYKTFGTKTFTAKNMDELKKYLTMIQKKVSIKELILQEIIPANKKMKVTSFTAFCIDGEIKTHWVGEKIREHPFKFGTATFCKSVIDKELINISSPLLKELNYTGVCEVEYIKDPRDNKYKLIEINSRSWLWIALAIRCGIDYPIIIYNYLNEKELIFSNEYLSEIKWIHFWTDFFYSALGIVKKKYSLGEIINSYKGEKEWAVYSLDDIKPFLFEFLLLPYILKKRKNENIN